MQKSSIVDVPLDSKYTFVHVVVFLTLFFIFVSLSLSLSASYEAVEHEINNLTELLRNYFLSCERKPIAENTTLQSFIQFKKSWTFLLRLIR